MILASAVAIAALAFAAISLFRLSRLPQAPAAVEDRTFATLGSGDVVLTPQGDWIVEGRSELSEDGARADVFALRSGRERCWLLVPPEGAVALTAQPPDSPHPDRARAARTLDRASLELLPGA